MVQYPQAILLWRRRYQQQKDFPGWCGPVLLYSGRYSDVHVCRRWHNRGKQVYHHESQWHRCSCHSCIWTTFATKYAGCIWPGTQVRWILSMKWFLPSTCRTPVGSCSSMYYPGVTSPHSVGKGRNLHSWHEINGRKFLTPLWSLATAQLKYSVKIWRHWRCLVSLKYSRSSVAMQDEARLDNVARKQRSHDGIP